MELIHDITVKNLHIIPANLELFKKDLNNKEGGKNLECIIRVKRKQCTNEQRKYYFKIIVKILSDYTGYEKTEMHVILKEMFLGYDENDILISSESLNTLEKEEYHEEIRRWALNEENVRIPKPNEVDFA